MGRRGFATVASVVCALAVLPCAAIAQSVPNIVFASDRDGTYDIWKMNPDGTGQVKLAGTPTAHEFSPVPSPDGTKIAFIRGDGACCGEPEGLLITMNADGTGQQTLTFAANDPSWSPSGATLAFGSIGHSGRDGQVWRIDADGTDEIPLTDVDFPARSNYGTSWSPDGARIAFHAVLGDLDPANEGIWTVNPDGTGLVQLTQTFDSADTDPDWSPSGTKIAFARFQELWTMNQDGTGQQDLTTPGREPAWSPDGSQIAYFGSIGGADQEIARVNADGTGATQLTSNTASDVDPEWLLVPAGYPRPKGASPMRIALTIAYPQCTTPDLTHGSPLSSPSCSSPQHESDYLTVGTADANSLPPRSEAGLRLDTIVGNPATPGDQADVRIRSFVDDVFTKPGLADYIGDVRTQLTIRVTDRDNSGPAPNTGTLTVAIGFNTPCTANTDPQEGSACTLDTTWDALIPGLVKEGKRTIWQLDQVELQDAGADANATTTGDNTVLARPGVFIP